MVGRLRSSWLLIGLIPCIFVCGLAVDGGGLATDVVQATKPQRGFIQMTFHFADVDYAKLKSDSKGLAELQGDIIKTLIASLLATSEATNGTEVTAVKAVVTDVAVADPDWDNDDDEHDYDDGKDHHPHDDPNHRYPLDCFSTVIVARASILGQQDLRVLKAFRLLLEDTPELVWLGDFAKAYGVPECLVATVHVDNSFSTDNAFHVSAEPQSSLTPAALLPISTRSACGRPGKPADSVRGHGLSMAAPGETQQGVKLARIACGAMVVLVVSAMLFATLVMNTAQRVALQYGMADVEDVFGGPATEL